MAGVPERIYVGQTSLQIRLSVHEDLTNIVNRILIKYRKPNGFEGWWRAEIIDYTNGIIAFNVPVNSTGLDDTGYWSVWAYIYYRDGSVSAGDVFQFAVYQQGKAYIAFPYGQNAVTGETAMATEAFEILYDNTTSGLVATNVQDVIDEIYAALQAVQSPAASTISYDNTNSGYPANDVQSVLDYMAARQITLRASVAAHNKTLFVDPSRTDDYVETGSIIYPFKDIASAIDSSTTGDVISLANGTYVENVVLPDGVSLSGGGTEQTIINGYVWSGATESNLQNFEVLGELKTYGSISVRDVDAYGSVSVLGTDAVFSDVEIESSSGVALTVGNGVDACSLQMNLVNITAEDGSSAIDVKSESTLSWNFGTATNDSDTNPTILASDPVSRVLLCNISLANESTDPAASCGNLQNDATYALSNALSVVSTTHGIACGTAYTVSDGVYVLDPTHAVTGSNLVIRSSVEIGFTPVGQITSTNIQDAIEEVFSGCKSGTDSPPTYTPDGSKKEFYLNTNTNILYLYNGSAWYKTGLTVA